MTADQAVIEIESLSAGYQQAILRDVSFSVPGASTSVIIGRSGCGKTTLLKTMIGLILPLSGTIHYFGRPLNPKSEKEQRALYQRIGILYQGSALLNSLSVQENISLPLCIHHPEMPKDFVDEMVALRLEQVGLPRAARLFPAELSGGMRKRVGLARALILDPDIIFCDEPSAGLDPSTAAGLDQLILSLRDRLGVTFVVVSHELASIRTIADRILFVHDGMLAFNGTLAEADRSGHPGLNAFLNRTNT